MRVVKTFSELITLAYSDTNELVKYEIGLLNDIQAHWITETIKLSVQNFKITVDNYAIKHIVKHHGNPATEVPRGQIAVTPHDFTLLPDILHNPDKYSYAGRNRLQNHILIYEKILDVHIYCLLELRAKRKELTVQTFYKRKAPTQ